MRVLYVAFLLCLMVMFSASSVQAQSRKDGIVAVVNSDAITQSDLNDRLRLIMASSGLQPSPDVFGRLRPQIMGSLIEETIKLQEADRLNIAIEPQEIETAIDAIATQNKTSGAEFRMMLQKGAGIRLSTLRDQIRAQNAWAKIVMRQIRPKIEVTDSDIDFELAQMRTHLGQNEAQLSEIFIPIENPKNEQAAAEFGAKLVSELKKDPEKNFPAFARQFSRAPTGPAGGDAGWVRAGLLPEKLDATVQALTKGEISAPIRSLTGLHIFWVRDQRVISEETLPDRDTVMKRIGNERLDRAQRRYYLDLKSSAFIDERGA